MTARERYPIDQSPLFRLNSRNRLAQRVFNVELSWLESLARQGDANFRVFDVVQGAKKRQVEIPKPILERLHRRIFTLLERIEKPDYLHSGVKGRSYITNAKVHVGLVPLVKLDLKKFYPSVSGALVYRFFCSQMQCSPDVAGLLTTLTTYDNHVPTGSCASQLLAFFATKPMFDALDEIAIEHGVRGTVYVDDLTFSGREATPSYLWKIKQCVHAHGFAYHKERIYTCEQLKLVTGVIIDGNRIAVLPSKEFEIWRRQKALEHGDLPSKAAAINSLIGSVVAAGQIEARLLKRLGRLRAARAEVQLLQAAAMR